VSKIQDVINKLIVGVDLSEGEAEDTMKSIMSGEATPSQIASFLTALRVKGETVDEITAFARVMRQFSVKISPRVSGTLVDTCGTGGDKIKTFNISTAAMFVAAGAGVPIAKHGNRSVTSKAGSADVVEAIGVKIDLPEEGVKRCIEEVGIGFMFAPRFHPAMKHAAPVRKEMGIRTVFNILGPLTNPAGARAQLMGVYDASLTEKLATVLDRLGCERAMVTHGLDGLDEILGAQGWGSKNVQNFTRGLWSSAGESGRHSWKDSGRKREDDAAGAEGGRRAKARHSPAERRGRHHGGREGRELGGWS
jgi:anthranilate phosphoribosyltransferase